MVSGNSYALESLETTFHQDLNGDGVIGFNPTMIQTDTNNSSVSTSLAELGSNYFLYAAGTTNGPELQFNGAAVTAGEFGGWTAIGAVQTASGYDIAWKDASAGLYTVWSTDGNGNYVANDIGVVSGNSYALESLETTFHQDLNGDGVVGLYAAPGTTLQISSGGGDDRRWRYRRGYRRQLRLGNLRRDDRNAEARSAVHIHRRDFRFHR